MTKARILVVEDEAIITMEIESSLQNLGYEVTSVVNNGDKAVQKAEEDKPDLILMDIRIQGDKDGIETAEIIRNKFGIPVIFSTAYLDEERIERAKITMPFGYVLKPIQERDLKVTLEMALYVAKVDKERRKAEEKLKVSEEKFRLLATHAPVGIYLDDKEGNAIYINEKCTELVGAKAEEALGLNWVPLLHPDDRERVTTKWGEAVKNGAEFHQQYRFVHTDGRVVWIQGDAVPLKDSDGTVILFVGTLADITQLKE